MVACIRKVSSYPAIAVLYINMILLLLLIHSCQSSALVRKQDTPITLTSISPLGVPPPISKPLAPLAFVGGIRQLSKATGTQGDAPSTPTKRSLRLRSISNSEQLNTPPRQVSERIRGALDYLRKKAKQESCKTSRLRGIGSVGGDPNPCGDGSWISYKGDKGPSRVLRSTRNIESNENDNIGDEEDNDGIVEDEDDYEDEDESEDEEYDPMTPRGPLENNNYGEVWLPVQTRPRRNRKSNAIRRLVQECLVKPSSLIYPLFVHDEDRSVPIASLPGQRRHSPSDILREIDEARRYGVNAFMLFPKIDDSLKSPLGEESYNPDGLIPRVIAAIKDTFPDVLVLADVALDPYSTSGHDGVVDEETGAVLNDMTVYQICKQAVTLARAGADMVCPSEMMDGRVSAIREALDMEGCIDTSILSYACKYASSLYGPFRDAVGSKLKKFIHKKTYQMDIANAREAEREAELDAQEGADMLMVKPGHLYLDILQRLRRTQQLPLAAYQVSGEYGMIKAAAEKGYINEQDVVFETLKAFKRAGADAIVTYYAKDAAKWIADDCAASRSFTEPCF